APGLARRARRGSGWSPFPGHEHVPFGPCQPDVEQTPLLVDVAAPDRQLTLLDVGEEDGVPLQSLRPVEREQMDAVAGGLAEALVQRVDEAADVAVELLREPHKARQVCLPRLLALAELLGHLLEQPLPDRKLA